MRSRRVAFPLVAALALLASIGLGIAYAQAQEVQVTLADFEIRPATITVTAGQPVRFSVRNVSDRIPHDLRIEGQGVTFEAVPGGDQNIMAGQTVAAQFTFTRPGTYQMWCPVGNHRERGMEGTFVVLAAGVAPARAGGPTAALVAGVLAAAGATLVGVGFALKRTRRAGQ